MIAFNTYCATYMNMFWKKSETSIFQAVAFLIYHQYRLKAFVCGPIEVCFLTFYAIVSILAQTADIISSEHRPITEVGHPGIEPGTLRFQDNHETHYATIKVKSSMARSPSVENLLPQFVGKLRYYQLLAVTLLRSPMGRSQLIAVGHSQLPLKLS